MESEPKLTPREKSHLQEKFSSEEEGTHDTASSRTASPTHYQQAIPAPVMLILMMMRNDITITTVIPIMTKDDAVTMNSDN